ncbi:hypothetical protein EV142_101685 [Flavobacterium circumlabens]|uniref:Uncharacterized protein n=1 Tax=Flavobacterium circumlabens TaxID=2133765 RepID=A0ABY2B6U6_9FLAO|nr:hypothetical protein EV142_101685 [Flavobacterium circumlabens]
MDVNFALKDAFLTLFLNRECFKCETYINKL